MKKGLIEKNASINHSIKALVVEYRLIGILVYKRTVSIDCLKSVKSELL